MSVPRQPARVRARRRRRRAPLVQQPRGDRDADGAARRASPSRRRGAGCERAMDDTGEDRKYAIVVEGHAEPVGFTALYGLVSPDRPGAGGADRRRRARQGGRPPRRGADDRQGLRRVRRPPRLRAHPRLQRGRQAGRRPASAGGTRGRCAGTCPATASWPTARSGACLPDEFRAAAADLLSERRGAELLADGGAAAAGPEFFRSAEFLAAEGVTHTLRISPTGRRAAGPAGRPRGPRSRRSATRARPTATRASSAPQGVPLDPAEIDWSATGLVSIFVRHRLGGEPPLRGATERNEVQIADPALPRKSRPSDRQQIRRNAERGYEVRRVAGPGEPPTPSARGFLAAYEQTMRRAGAAQRYFFGAEYFDAHPRLRGTAGCSWRWSPAGRSPRARSPPAATGCCTTTSAAPPTSTCGDSPMKNVVAAIVDFGEELGLPLNLGGGMRRRATPWRSSSAASPTAPSRFTPQRSSATRRPTSASAAGATRAAFFPAYRAP